MKATLFILVYVMSLGCIYAQEVNCGEKQKELSALVKQSKFKEANELLSILRKKCPTESEELYLLGITTLQNNVDLASATTKEAAVRDLLKLYDQYDANFPNNKNGNLVNKAMTLYDSNIRDNKELYAILNKAFTSNPDQFTNPKALYIYFRLYNVKFKNKDAGITLEQLLEKLNEVETVIQKNSPAFPEKAVEFKNASRACKSLVKDSLTPENLIPMAEKNFDANSKNTEWLAATANLLSDKCAASPIFGKIATQLHELQPSSKSAYHLGNYNLKNQKIKKAVDYFSQSATLETDKAEKAKTYSTIATIVAATDKKEARNMILSAIENDAKNGSYYLFLANLYSNSITECGTTNSMVQKAICLLANQTAQKAAEVEPRLKATAEQLAKEYAKNSPTKEELEQIQKTGGKVTIGCWINETVQF